jgi:hypothetical protein
VGTTVLLKPTQLRTPLDPVRIGQNQFALQERSDVNRQYGVHHLGDDVLDDGLAVLQLNIYELDRHIFGHNQESV